MEEKKAEEMKRIGILLSKETKEKWDKFADEHNLSTISKLIRDAVEFYMKMSYLDDFSNLSHDLKEPLTVIKGFSQLIIENYAEKIQVEVLLKIKEIFEQSKYLEKKINEIITGIDTNTAAFDVLIIEDDKSTIKVITDFLELNGKSCKGVTSGLKGLEELGKTTPKLILLDIILPDKNGYEICKEIKSDKRWKNIPVYFITAIPESEVRKNMETTNANGFLLKPFDFAEFKKLFQYL